MSVGLPDATPPTRTLLQAVLASARSASVGCPPRTEPVAIDLPDTLVVESSGTIVADADEVAGLRYTVASRLPPLAGRDHRRRRQAATTAPVPPSLRRFLAPARHRRDRPDQGRADARSSTKRRRHHAVREGRGAARLLPRRGAASSTTPTSTAPTTRPPSSRSSAKARLLRAVRERVRGDGPVARHPRPGRGGVHPGHARRRRHVHVTSHDAHAWPEVYLSGLGWTHLFDPTPGNESGRRRAGSAAPRGRRDRRPDRHHRTPAHRGDPRPPPRDRRTVGAGGPSAPGTTPVPPTLAPARQRVVGHRRVAAGARRARDRAARARWLRRRRARAQAPTACSAPPADDPARRGRPAHGRKRSTACTRPRSCPGRADAARPRGHGARGHEPDDRTADARARARVRRGALRRRRVAARRRARRVGVARRARACARRRRVVDAAVAPQARPVDARASLTGRRPGPSASGSGAAAGVAVACAGARRRRRAGRRRSRGPRPRPRRRSGRPRRTARAGRATSASRIWPSSRHAHTDVAVGHQPQAGDVVTGAHELGDGALDARHRQTGVEQRTAPCAARPGRGTSTGRRGRSRRGRRGRCGARRRAARCCTPRAGPPGAWCSPRPDQPSFRRTGRRGRSARANDCPRCRARSSARRCASSR